jgi:uncharacterized membrane protein YfcA
MVFWRYSFIFPLLLLVSISGSYTGKKIVNKIPQEKFRIVVLIAIALVSLNFIIRSLL